MANRLPLAFALAAALAACGCAGRPREVIVKVPSFYEFSSARGPLHVVVDPYDRPDKSRYIFETNFARRGYFPVHLIFQNFGVQSYSLRSATATLRYADGTRAAAVPLDRLPSAAREHPLASTFSSEVLGGLVGPGETRSGFIFFSKASSGAPSEAASLDLEGMVDEGTGNRFDLAISLQPHS